MSLKHLMTRGTRSKKDKRLWQKELQKRGKS